MKTDNSATAAVPIAVNGSLLAVLAVLAFSFTFPATHWALQGFGPWTTVTVRAAFAGLLGASWLFASRAEVPDRRHWPALAVVAAGVVIGFPLLTTLALRSTQTSHAAVVVGALPLTTAALGAAVSRTRHTRAFWVAASAGTVAVGAFALAQSHGRPTGGDMLLFASLVVCAAGYTAGGLLARILPGQQVAGWALVAALPLTLPAAGVALLSEPVHPNGQAVVGLLYIAVISQLVGLAVWYRGMAVIGVARASQFQLAQPLLTLVWSGLLLGERLGPATPLTALAVLVCVAVTQRG